MEISYGQKEYLDKVGDSFISTFFVPRAMINDGTKKISPLRYLIGFYTKTNYISSALQQLITNFTTFNTCFAAVESVLSHWIIKWQTKIHSNATGTLAQLRMGRGTVPKSDSTPSNEIVKMNMDIYNAAKKACRLWENADIRPFLHLLMRSVWSLDPAANKPITLRIKWTDSTFNNIPVSAVQVIYWVDLIGGMLDRYACIKHSLNPWWKYWLLDLFLVHLYQQILNYFIDVLHETRTDELTAASWSNKSRSVKPSL